MQQLSVRRLTKKEGYKEAQQHFDTIPEFAPIKWICSYLGKSDRTVARYRAILFENCLEYQSIACFNGIDNPVLHKRQIQLLEEFSALMGNFKCLKVSLAVYGRVHPHPLAGETT